MPLHLIATPQILDNPRGIKVQPIILRYLLPSTITSTSSVKRSVKLSEKAVAIRCRGKSSWPLYVGTLSAVLNTGLNYGLIFGNLGMPKLGFLGAAWASVISQIVGAIVILIMFCKLYGRIQISFNLGKSGFNQYFAMLLPVVLNEFFWSVGQSVNTFVYGHMGTEELAGMSLTGSVQGLTIGALSGLSQAAGDYILFIDSDDWIESSTLETFKDFSIKKEYDVIVCDHYIDYGIKKTYHKFEVSDNLLENIVIHGGGNLFTKFISRQYIIDNKIQFEKDMDRFEDLLFCISLACNHPKWAYIPKAFYHYCQYSNPNSLMKKPHNSAINYQRLRNNCPTIPTDIQDYLYANEAMATLLEDLLSYHDFSKQFKQLESKSYPIAYWPLLQTAFKGHIHYSISRGALICIIKIKELIKHILSKI